MALNLKGQGFETSGSMTIVGNAVELEIDELAPRAVSPPTATTVVASVEQTLFDKLTTPPFVSKAFATVTASMPPAANLAGAAEVRASQGDPKARSQTLIVDFQGQRTVSEIAGPDNVTIQSVAPWLGTKFDDPTTMSITPGAAVTFKEIQTERLLVTLASPILPADFAQNGSVVIPTPPSNLELLVNGTRAWFSAGPAVGDPFTAKVDISGPVSTAAATGQAVLTLRAAEPAVLTLAGTATLLNRYLVAFPEGVVRTVDAPSEGVYPLSLPISALATTDQPDPSATPPLPDTGPGTWLVRQVVLDVSAKIPAIRVQPADGPQISDEAELVLDPDHALVVRLLPAATGVLAAVTGVRLLVTAGADGAELAGTLRSNKVVNGKDEPGDPLPKGALGPVTLQATAATPPAAPGWIDLALTTPHQLTAGEHVWLELQVARGSLVWKLAEVSGSDADNAVLRRRTSSGKYVELTTFGDVENYAAALRVVGQERPNDPLAAVQVAVAGGSDTVAGVPTQGGTTLILGLTGPGFAPTPIAGGGGDLEVPLELTISTPGSYAITSAELQYTQP